jgi:Zn-finger nucleic acid-binding protein
MTAHPGGELEVEACSRCAGVWLRHPSLIAFKFPRDLILSVPGLAESLRCRSRSAGDARTEFGEEPLGVECPTCANELSRQQVEDGVLVLACMACGGAWVEADRLARLIWKGASSPASRTAGDARPRRRFDRFTFHDPLTLIAALPLATLAGLAINSTFLVGFFRPFHIGIHEFGHASVAWFSGRRALPLPIGWTSWQPDRSVVVYVALLFLIGVLMFTAWKERLRGAMVLAGALALIQFVMTWAFSQRTVELWITFGGIGGEFVISTVLIVLFYFRLPDRVRWDFWRYPILVVSASTLWENVAFWARVERGEESIPWGSILGAGDAGGDMDRLVLEHAWPSARIICSYNGLGTICLVLLAVVFAGFLAANREAVSNAMARRLGRAGPVA